MLSTQTLAPEEIISNHPPTHQTNVANAHVNLNSTIPCASVASGDPRRAPMLSHPCPDFIVAISRRPRQINMPYSSPWWTSNIRDISQQSQKVSDKASHNKCSLNGSWHSCADIEMLYHYCIKILLLLRICRSYCRLKFVIFFLLFIHQNEPISFVSQKWSKVNDIDQTL